MTVGILCDSSNQRVTNQILEFHHFDYFSKINPVKYQHFKGSILCQMKYFKTYQIKRISRIDRVDIKLYTFITWLPYLSEHLDRKSKGILYKDITRKIYNKIGTVSQWKQHPLPKHLAKEYKFIYMKGSKFSCEI